MGWSGLSWSCTWVLFRFRAFLVSWFLFHLLVYCLHYLGWRGLGAPRTRGAVDVVVRV